MLGRSKNYVWPFLASAHRPPPVLSAPWLVLECGPSGTVPIPLRPRALSCSLPLSPPPPRPCQLLQGPRATPLQHRPVTGDSVCHQPAGARRPWGPGEEKQVLGLRKDFSYPLSPARVGSGALGFIYLGLHSC